MFKYFLGGFVGISFSVCECLFSGRLWKEMTNCVWDRRTFRHSQTWCITARRREGACYPCKELASSLSVFPRAHSSTQPNLPNASHLLSSNVSLSKKLNAKRHKPHSFCRFSNVRRHVSTISLQTRHHLARSQFGDHALDHVRRVED